MFKKLINKLFGVDKGNVNDKGEYKTPEKYKDVEFKNIMLAENADKELKELDKQKEELYKLQKDISMQIKSKLKGNLDNRYQYKSIESTWKNYIQFTLIDLNRTSLVYISVQRYSNNTKIEIEGLDTQDTMQLYNSLQKANLDEVINGIRLKNYVTKHAQIGAFGYHHRELAEKCKEIESMFR